MAKYTVELSSMLCAFANLQEIQDQDEHLSIKNIDNLELFDYYSHNFKYNIYNIPNYIIDKYAKSFFERYVTHVPDNFTDNKDLNAEIMNKFYQAFIRHFYGREIGQENPLYFWVILQGYLQEHMPFFIQAYQQMIIDNQNFITNISDATNHQTGNQNANTTGDSSAIAGRADTPQNELNFALNTGDPAKDYNFNYSSSVDGTKSQDHTTSVADSTADSTSHAQGRNATIASLVNELQRFSNGIYIEMFNRAENYGLFLKIVS